MGEHHTKTKHSSSATHKTIHSDHADASHSKHKVSVVKHKTIKKTSSKKSSSSKAKTSKVVKKVSHKVVSQPKRYSKKFCPNCGNIIEDSNTLCSDCRTTDFDFKTIKIFLCTNCKSYNYKNKWKKFTSLNNVIDIVISESTKHKAKFIHMSEDSAENLLSFKAGVHKDITLTVSINHEKFDLPANFDVTLCPKCSKQGTKYFEGILQTRNVTDEIRLFIKNDLEKQKSAGVHVNKEELIEGDGLNIDYYYTNKRYLKVIAEKLRKEFGATLKHNAQLFSIDWETSKNLYRLNLLVEFPKYNKNDVLKIGDQLYLIISMDSKVHAVNLKNNSKTLLAHKDTYEILRGVEVMLIKKYPEYEVLDPNTYYQARLMNPENLIDKIEVNQKIKVIIDGGEAWLIKAYPKR